MQVMAAREDVDLAKKLARERLLAELKDAPHGGQSALARRLGISTAHMSNMVKGKALPGEHVMQVLLAHWKISAEDLLAQARGEPVVVADRVHPTIAMVAERDGYTEIEAETATALTRGERGLASIDEASAADLLEMARHTRKMAAKIVRVAVEDDDI